MEELRLRTNGWKTENPVAAISATYTDNALSNNDSVWVVMTSNAPCN